MHTPPRYTRRLSQPITETAHRRLRGFAKDVGLSEAEALSFLLENVNGLLDEAALMHRLAAFRARLETPPRD